MMTKEEVAALIKRYANGECSPEEMALLETWYVGQRALHQQELSEAQLEHDLEAIYLKLPKPSRSPAIWKRIAAAAVILLALSFGTYYFIANHTGSNNPPVVGHGEQPITNNDIDPGGNRAILTLADGRKITLDEAANGTLAEESGIRINKTADGQIVYEIQSLKTKDQSEASPNYNLELTTYNSIETPRGGQYKIVLPDSSVVWLNAASSLKYPTRFSGAERRVELTGEAYFQIRQLVLPLADQTQDIKHETASAQSDAGNKSKIENRTSKIPFIVATATQEVQVLGTQFNINAYDDETIVKTTLLEGSIAVSLSPFGGGRGRKEKNPVNSASLQLVPGERSTLQGNSLTKQTVDTETAIAWKNGVFFFRDMPFEELMRQLARWYDFEYEGEYDKDARFTLYMPRKEKLSKILELMEAAGKVRFNIVNEEGGRKKVVISRKD